MKNAFFKLCGAVYGLSNTWHKLTKKIITSIKRSRKMENLIIKGTVAFFDTIKAGTRLQTKSQAEAWLKEYSQKFGIDTLYMLTQNSAGKEVYYRIGTDKPIAAITYDTFKVEFLDLPEPEPETKPEIEVEEELPTEEAKDELPIEQVEKEPDNIVESNAAEHYENAPVAEANVVENDDLGENKAEELKRELAELDGQIEALKGKLADIKSDIEIAINEAVKTALNNILAKLG